MRASAPKTSAAAEGVVSVEYAPAGFFALTARDEATRAVLSARSVVAEPGAVYILWMWPLTSTEQ